jgi:tetratricopeptide (TPR) repeat protein
VGTSRLDKLTQFLETNPKDSFARFGLAMEYASLGDSEKALENFRKLWEVNPNYVAAYFQAGKVLATAGQIEQAREVLTSGIEAAVRIRDQHAQSEMQAFLSEL